MKKKNERSLRFSKPNNFGVKCKQPNKSELCWRSVRDFIRKQHEKAKLTGSRFLNYFERSNSGRKKTFNEMNKVKQTFSSETERQLLQAKSTLNLKSFIDILVG